MSIYLILIVIASLLLLIRRGQIYQNYISRHIITLMVILFLFIIYVFRSIYVGKDYFQYYTWYSLYNLLASNSNSNSNIEIGYAYLSNIARYFGHFKIISIFTFIIVIISILCVKKYSGQNINQFTLLSFFILLGLFTTMFNPIRQSIAFGFLSLGIAVLLVGLKYNFAFIYLFYLLFVFLAYNFHGTGLFGIFFFFILIFRYKYTKKFVIMYGLLMFILSFTGIMNKFFVRIISWNSIYYFKYHNNTLNDILPFSQILIKIGPLIIQLVFLYIFISKYEDFTDRRLNFLLWGYLFYLFMFTAPGNDIARRLQIYTSIFPLIYSCLFIDGINVGQNKINKISYITKFLFISFWMLFYIFKLYLNTSGIVPYSFTL